MEKIIDFLNKAAVYYLATTDGEKPHVRPLGFVMEYDGKLTFCTNNKKEMYKQMISNPYVEISCFDGEDTLRISGKAVFVTSDDSQEKALELVPRLKGMYSVGDGIYEIFSLDEVAAAFYTRSGEVKEVLI